jgi:transposase
MSADADELPVALERIVALLDRHKMERDTVTLAFDKGSAALANTLALEQAGVGWIAALPWNQTPTELRERDSEKLLACSSDQPGVRATSEPMVVHGKEYFCVVKYSASFAGEQLHSLRTSLSRALQGMGRLSVELSKPRAHFNELGIRNKIARWRSSDFLSELVRYDLQLHDGRWQLQFDFDHQALQQLLAHRLGRAILLTNRHDWTVEQVVAGYSGPQRIETVFRGLKDGDSRGWGPMHHWTDSMIRIHAFYCMPGVSLLQSIHKQSQAVWPGLSVEQLMEEFSQIQQFVLLYPAQGDKGRHARPLCFPNNRFRNRASRICSGWTNSVVPCVGNTKPARDPFFANHLHPCAQASQ